MGVACMLLGPLAGVIASEPGASADAGIAGAAAIAAGAQPERSDEGYAIVRRVYVSSLVVNVVIIIIISTDDKGKYKTALFQFYL